MEVIKLKIMVDLDGVVWDIMGVFVDIYNKLYNENVKYEDIDDWYYFSQDRFDVVYPLTLPKIMEYPCLNNNISSYLFILNKVHDVNILTAEMNPIGTLEEKLRTLQIIKGTHYNEIIKVNPKEKEKKVNYEADIYIDDNPCMAKDMERFPKRVLLLYNQPWNKNYEESGNVIRVFGWEEILGFIDRIEYTKRNDINAVFC